MSEPPKPAPRPQPAPRPGSVSPANQVKRPPPPIKFAKDKQEQDTPPLPKTPPPSSPTLKPDAFPKMSANRSKSSNEVHIHTTDENNVSCPGSATPPPRPASAQRSMGASPLGSPSTTPNSVARPKSKGKGAPPPPPVGGGHKASPSVGSSNDVHAEVAPSREGSGRKPPPPIHRKQNSNVSITSEDRPHVPQKPTMPKRPVSPQTSTADTATSEVAEEEAPPRSVKDKASFLQRQMSQPKHIKPSSPREPGRASPSGLSPKPSQTSKFSYSDPQRDARMAMAAAMTGRTMADMRGFEKKREVQPVESDEEEGDENEEESEQNTSESPIDTAEHDQPGAMALAAAGAGALSHESLSKESTAEESETAPVQPRAQPPARPAGRPKSAIMQQVHDAQDTEAQAHTHTPPPPPTTADSESVEDSFDTLQNSVDHTTRHTAPTDTAVDQGEGNATPGSVSGSPEGGSEEEHVDFDKEKDAITTHPGHERQAPPPPANADHSETRIETPVSDISMYTSELKLHRCHAREKLGLELFEMLELSGETDSNKTSAKQFAAVKSKIAKSHKTHIDKFTKAKKSWSAHFHKSEANLTHKGMLSRMSHAKDESSAEAKAEHAMNKDSELCAEFDALRQNAHLAAFSDEGAYYRELESIEEKLITDMSQDESKALVKKQKAEMEHLSKAAKKGKDPTAQQALLEAKQRQDDEREALSAEQNERRTKVHTHHQVLQRKAKEKANQIVEDVGKGVL